MKPVIRLAVLGTGLLFAAGSSSMMPGPHYAKLDVKNVKSIDVVLVGGKTTFCPAGDPPQLKIVARTADGKRLETWSGAGGGTTGKLDFAQFEFSVSAGQVDGKGLYFSPPDPFATLDKQVTIGVRVAGNPSVASQLVLDPAYDCGGVANFGGEVGMMGDQGEPGRQGRNGESGDSSRRATDGERGGTGGDGRDGRNGANAGAVEVAMGLVASEKHGVLALARVKRIDTGAVRYFLLDPKGAPLLVSVTGGAGGSGGSGGSGGAGGFGGSNDIEGGGDGGNGGDGGDGGRGGGGGDGGNGGSVVIKLDRAHPELKRLVEVQNGGGAGGFAGGAGSGGSPGPGGSSASGRHGENGRVGVSGQGGTREGRPGRDGAPVQITAADGKRLFGDEIAAGMKIQ